MRFLENLFIKLFSLIIFALSLLIILIGLNFTEIDGLTKLTKLLFLTELSTKITIGVCVVFVLVSLKIFLTSRGKPKNGKDGIILENASGKLIISKESLDNLIFNAAKDIPGTESISSKTYLDLDQNLRVFVTVNMTQDISIKELSTTLQSRIKSAIKETADLDVSEVNVKIKNIVNKKNRKIKESYVEKIEEPNTKAFEDNIITDNKVEIKDELDNDSESNNE